MRDALSRTSVMITLILATMLVMLCTIGGVVWLVITGHDAVAATAAVGAPLTAVLGVVASRLKDLHTAVQNTTTTPPEG